MLKANTLVSLLFLSLAVPGVALAGLDIFPADGPAPKIQIEQPKPVTYTVKKGDTVAGIAKKFSVDTKKLMAANGMTDARKLRAGKTLTIPGVTAPAKAPVAVAKASAAPSAAAVKSASATAPVAAKTATPTPAAAAAQGGVTTQVIGQGHAAEEKADATARRFSRKGQVLDPGVVEDAPVKRRRGKKGKFLEPPAPPPTITIDARTRATFGKTGVITNNSDVPQAIRDEFYRYALKWVDELETIGVGTFHSKKIRREGNDWVATYRVILRESIGAEVKKVDYVHTPYVGHITYVQRVFTCRAPTKQAALQGPFTTKDENIREIFSYSGDKKAWR